MEKEKKRRARRSLVAVERDILEAVMEIVKESGFQKVSLIAVATRANVQLSVIYRHFGSLEKLLDRYVQSLDYWMNTVLDLRDDELDGAEAYKSSLQHLMSAFYKNQEMQKLMVWELSEDNVTTRRTMKRRELVNTEMISVYNRMFEDSGIDIQSITAILTSGVYYIAINRKRVKYFDVDFSTKQGRERLFNTLGYLCDLVFAALKAKQEAKSTAKILKEKGVAADIIEEATKLTVEEIEAL